MVTPGTSHYRGFLARIAGKTSPVTKKAPISLPKSLVSFGFFFPRFFVLSQFMQMPNAAPLEVIATRFFFVFHNTVLYFFSFF